MADILLDEQGAPATPASGKGLIWIDQTTSRMVQTTDGAVRAGTLSATNSVASQGPGFAADTYLTGSGIQVPSFGMEAGQTYEWVITGSKTAAGVAAAIVIIRTGSLQTTGDAPRLTLTAAAIQTAALDAGILTVTVDVRNVGAAGVIAGGFGWSSGAGFGGGASGVSAGFDNSAVGGQFVGLSLNGGTSAAWTINSVQGRMYQ